MQALQFMAHAASSIPAPTSVISWKKLHQYLLSLTRNRSQNSSSSSDVKWADLSSKERRVCFLYYLGSSLALTLLR